MFDKNIGYNIVSIMEKFGEISKERIIERFNEGFYKVSLETFYKIVDLLSNSELSLESIADKYNLNKKYVDTKNSKLFKKQKNYFFNRGGFVDCFGFFA